MNPPRIPTWLLERCLQSPLRESLMGDLIEQYRCGRSASWFWRQALVTILAVSAHDMRDRMGLAITGLALGWIIYLAPSLIIVPFGRTMQSLLAPWLVHISGPQWLILFLGRAPYELPVYFACFAGGWLVASLYRSHGVPLAILLAVTIGTFEYGHIAWMLLAYDHPPMPMAALLLPLLLVIVRPISVLVGALSVS